MAPFILFKNEKNIRRATASLTVGIVAAAFIALARHYPYQFRLHISMMHCSHSLEIM